MRAFLINPPFREPIMRRYVASYFAPNFLMPPIELMGVGAVLKQWCSAEVRLVDAIAHKLSLEECIKQCKDFDPDIIISMSGFGIFPHDMAALSELKNNFPDTKLIVFGYLPTQFPKSTLENTQLDMVLMGEPELTLRDLVNALGSGKALGGIAGLAWRDEGKVVVNERRERIADLDALPFPDISLIDIQPYIEPYLDRPIAVIMSARGCPYQCTYCVTTYGRKFVQRSVDNVIKELHYIRNSGIRNVRFLDDTLTVNRKWLKSLCRRIIDELPDLNFTCLSRVDTLDANSLELLKKAGCRRLYIGIESGSQRILDYYRKGYKLEKIKPQVDLIKESGIELSCFFIVGAPIETISDVDASIELAKSLDVDYVIVTKLQYWPGTELFEQNKDKVEFSLFPYKNRFIDDTWEEKFFTWERRFYRRFYLRLGYIIKRSRHLLTTPGDIIKGFIKLVGYVFSLRRHKSREDFI